MEDSTISTEHIKGPYLPPWPVGSSERLGRRTIHASRLHHGFRYVICHHTDCHDSFVGISAWKIGSDKYSDTAARRVGLAYGFPLTAADMIYFIMPVGSDIQFWSKRSILERVLNDFEEEGHFPLERASAPSFEVEKSLHEMSGAKLIIGDLALERPSCYFEVGLAQGAHLPVELIAPERTPLHQVSRREDVRFYANLEAYEELIRQLLSRTSLQSGLGGSPQ
jgi:hypothetical protein